jgi:hypothetical protein
MHPELLSAVVAEHHRDLRSAMAAHRSQAASAATSARPRRLPRFRLSWTGTTLAAAGNRREKSLVIVISATRSL